MKKLLFAALAAAPTPALAGEVQEALQLLAAHAAHPLPPVSARDLDRVVRGQEITLVSGERIAGLAIIEAPKEAVWATVHDQAVTGDPAVHELRLSVAADGTEVWYGRMGLPSPLDDRQWVVRSTIDTELHRASGGVAWARSWTEVPGGLELARPALAAGHLPGVGVEALSDGVETPVNRGGWLLVSLGPDRTLVAYHARTDLGGSVPVWLVRDVARRQVGALLRRVARAAGASHPQVVPGSGS